MGNNHFTENFRCNHCFFLEACKRDGCLPEDEEERCEDFCGTDPDGGDEVSLEQFNRKMKDRQDMIDMLEELGYWEE